MNAILAVDPDTSILELLEDALEPEGYGLATAYSLDEAVSILHESRFDALIVDHRALLQWVGPDRDGEVLSQLAHRAPIVVLSTLALKESPLIPGIHRVMPKPFDLLELFSALEAIIASPAAV
jgi:DNA-binding response OmpR family regulator